METEIRIQLDRLITYRLTFDINKESAVRAEKALSIVTEKAQKGESDPGSLYDAYSQFRTSYDRAIDTKCDYYRTLARIKLLCNIPLDVSSP